MQTLLDTYKSQQHVEHKSPESSSLFLKNRKGSIHGDDVQSDDIRRP